MSHDGDTIVLAPALKMNNRNVKRSNVFIVCVREYGYINAMFRKLFIHAHIAFEKVKPADIAELYF